MANVTYGFPIMIDRMIIIHITPSLQYYINTPPEHIRTHGLVGDLVSSGFRANFGIHWVFNIKRIGFIMLWPLHICANILPIFTSIYQHLPVQRPPWLAMKKSVGFLDGKGGSQKLEKEQATEKNA